ncbi:MAG: hypothetical protein BMS9Abin33_0298 [Gammaproteobacteria bacterium]|nr:MAG: hypothetical protein BMS9Abin33_0298 [Gammaproteobacteria bacterium]
MKKSVFRFTVAFILLFPLSVLAASDINYAATTKDDDQGLGSTFNVDQSFETICVEYTNFF